MTLAAQLSSFDYLDLIAVSLLLGCWLGIGWWIDRENAARPSVSTLMADYRREWMVQMITRDPRIFDAQILGNLRQGTAFFASASMIALGGGLALVGNAERLTTLADDLSLGDDPTFVWELKLVFMLALVVNGFLKFVWSNRLFGYCAVLVSAVPNDVTDPLATVRATQAGEINVTAARSFNKGLRSVYFALATSAWLLGPLALCLAALVTFGILWRREFASQSRAVLMSSRPRQRAADDHTAS